ncbi:helicase-associated domain-containing protein [Agromyces sp. LHK192]|uniref:helicase-associated domain-containing protein n=1 Tax=Agromyces sp. LHK192 TaxID=2498704 RepID=UPI000FDA1730|nr:helicase-associated domain-containing protein [Agromyces sp. LHK192]
MTRDELAGALALREFDAAAIRDQFDLAEALLSADSLDSAIGRLDRRHLAVLSAATTAAGSDGVLDPAALTAELERIEASDQIRGIRDELLDDLADRLLVVRDDDERVRVPSAVTTRLAARLGTDLPTATELAATPPPVLQPVDAVDRRLLARRGAEAAYATVTATAELVSAIGMQPARELAKGGLSLPDSKRLAEATGVELDELPRLFRRAVEAGLVTRDGAYWLESDLGGNWCLLPAAERWKLLADRWRDRIPPALRELVVRRTEVLSAADFRADVTWLYPAGGRWVDEGLDRLADEADALGLAVDGNPVDPGPTVVAGDLDRAAEEIGAWFPTPVDKVYLQHDLSVVAPGPLAPAVDARLRGFADLEARDLASTYRVTAASVNRGLAAGESAESIRAFLESISLTGMPQPLEYLVQEAARRFGSVRVAAAPPSDAPALASVRSDDGELIGTLEVDQSLSSLGLRRGGDHRLLSRFAPDLVFWALSDAKYPVAAEDADGRILRLKRHRLAPAPSPAPRADPVADLIERLSNGDGSPATEDAWLARQLEAAARAKETLTVTVRMPGGQTADYLLAPASVANGRLRARDRKADIERTLPLSAIAAVGPAPAE